MKKRKPGIFITLEGPDGAGKSTQLALLGRALTRLGHKVLLTREPGGSPRAAAIRRLVLDNKGELSTASELLLFLADRAQHVHDTLLPALEAGKVVLCDRYSDSTFAYQGGGRGYRAPLLRSLDRFASGGLKPQLTLLFDLDAPRGLGRAAKGGRSKPDRMEALGLAFHSRVRGEFLKLAAKEPRRIKVIRVAGKSPAEVLDEGMSHLRKLL
ncbi:MAG: dTMP kinase [candidate division FCPU426 bacterium]